jgi:phage/plasmid-associated DNA primase
MEFVERHDLQKVHYLNSLTYSQMKPFYGKCKNDDERRIKYDNLKRFCQAVIKARGQMIRAYAYSLSTPIKLGGRLFCGLSVQGLPKAIRGFLMTHTQDVDMKNCHPVILKYLCIKHKIPCPNLQYYINHRDEVLSEFIDREYGKKLFLEAVNNDKRNTKEKNRTFKNFDSEMKMIQSIICTIKDYEEIRCNVSDDKKIKNWNGSTINRILCMYENKILEIAMSLCNEKGIEVCAPMFDGFMMYGEHEHDLLDEIEARVDEQYPGLDMKWSYKPHSTDIIMPVDFVIPTEISTKVKVAQNDKEARDIIYNELKSIIIYSDKSFYYKVDNLWISDESEIRSLLLGYVLKSDIYKRNEKNELMPYSHNVKNANNIVTALMAEVMANGDDNWVKQLFHSSLGYVLFNNGYWDCKNGLFYKNDSPAFDSTIIFTTKISYDYDETYDDEKYEQCVQEKLFTVPFGEQVGNYYLLQLGRALAGDCMKRFLVGIGPSNTGKSVISLALSAVCGGYYGAWNGANLAFKESGADEAQRLRWMYLLRFARIVVSNELSMNMVIDGNGIKRMANGGKDDITARVHHGNETHFKIAFLALLFAQDISRIKPLDDAVLTRLRAIPYEKVYVDEPSNELELKRDSNIENEVLTCDFKQAFIRILFKAYLAFHQGGRVEFEPEGIQQANKDVLGTETNVIDSFKTEFEITNNPEDFIRSSTIQDWLDHEKKGISITKFGSELNRYCKIHKIKEVQVKVKKIGGKPVRVWFGMRVIADE